MTFAKKLRLLREAKGLSEAKLADASGVSFATLRNYAMGRRAPSFEAVVKIARALGVTTEEFAACEFPYEAQRPVEQQRPTGPPPRRTGRKMPGKPKRGGG